jgi:hypothetical protein
MPGVYDTFPAVEVPAVTTEQMFDSQPVHAGAHVSFLSNHTRNHPSRSCSLLEQTSFRVGCQFTGSSFSLSMTDDPRRPHNAHFGLIFSLPRIN